MQFNKSTSRSWAQIVYGTLYAVGAEFKTRLFSQTTIRGVAEMQDGRAPR
jgi:hypothetical protein